MSNLLWALREFSAVFCGCLPDLNSTHQPRAQKLSLLARFSPGAARLRWWFASCSEPCRNQWRRRPAAGPAGRTRRLHRAAPGAVSQLGDGRVLTRRPILAEVRNGIYPRLNGPLTGFYLRSSDYHKPNAVEFAVGEDDKTDRPAHNSFALVRYGVETPSSA